jgi:crotonobetaine/carnitine-CoA ligase
MTETISHGVVGDVDVPNAPMSCGRPAAEYDVRVVAPDGSDVAVGEVGELRVRGRRGVSLFSRYLDDPEATEAAFDAHGFLRTGDLVARLPDGHLRFSDRAKDMLKVGGENVAASEVERVLLGVDGILEAAVVARPDERLGEVPVAFVVLEAGREVDDVAEAAIGACSAQLADFKVPRRILPVDDLPRTTLNKVAKAELRAQLREEVEVR